MYRPRATAVVLVLVVGAGAAAEDVVGVTTAAVVNCESARSMSMRTDAGIVDSAYQGEPVSTTADLAGLTAAGLVAARSRWLAGRSERIAAPAF